MLLTGTRRMSRKWKSGTTYFYLWHLQITSLIKSMECKYRLTDRIENTEIHFKDLLVKEK